MLFMAATTQKTKTWGDLQKTSVQVAKDTYLGVGGVGGGAKASPNKKRGVDKEVGTQVPLI